MYTTSVYEVSKWKVTRSRYFWCETLNQWGLYIKVVMIVKCPTMTHDIHITIYDPYIDLNQKNAVDAYLWWVLGGMLCVQNLSPFPLTVHPKIGVMVCQWWDTVPTMKSVVMACTLLSFPASKNSLVNIGPPQDYCGVAWLWSFNVPWEPYSMVHWLSEPQLFKIYPMLKHGHRIGVKFMGLGRVTRPPPQALLGSRIPP